MRKECSAIFKKESVSITLSKRLGVKLPPLLEDRSAKALGFDAPDEKSAFSSSHCRVDEDLAISGVCAGDRF